MGQAVSSRDPSTTVHLADCVIRAGAVYSMAANRSVYRAVALRDEWIVAVSEAPHGLDGLISSHTSVIDQYTAMQLYTSASAELNWESERRGTIQPRRLADLMAYRTNPITCPVDQLLGLRPVFTLVGGRAVHDPESMFTKVN
jgi:predicted amidohydrolase YtcJ